MYCRASSNWHAAFSLRHCRIADLQETLMLDSIEQAQQLCAMHGYEMGMQGNVPVVLLVKVSVSVPPLINTQGADLPW